MTDKPGKAKGAKTRDDRLKAALKANLARRKAQARARRAPEGKGAVDDSAAPDAGTDNEKNKD
ncbi:hypothetical protein DL237_10890 [Pseudooceanicola sediminis]|uniref:Uncharacterized protein n=1 Tax=Pseudooceanicola sediminis TaxID=2211117 RepID=A0A399J2R8_9RHOB|nr:hypothetical protein [Pseudooceanicola sediminis]KAA2313936.1 hypothetical protein E0K93_12585 [Puniceibacterium sp. HSS470]RII38749.1 hypothetical protein DL237_10890 [Pseudooceanicola sediminis]|tara:strand:- start:57586 stop:57774 length:189 start_codon:yes stop_codon:yes gene_type:complete